MSAASSIRAGAAFVELFVKDQRFIAGLRAAQNKLRGFGQSMSGIGRQMAMVGVQSAIPIGLAVQRFAQFDDQMRAVRAVAQGTEADFLSLSAAARRLAASGSFTAVQIGSMMLELAKAGIPIPQIEAATESVMNLARATGTEAGLASSILVRAMRQFNITGAESARIADLLTVTANASMSSVESLGEALSYAGPVAAQFNLSLEDTLAVLGTLSNVGIEGSNAGTALRRILTMAGADAAKLKDIFGVDALDAAGNLRPIVDILDEIGRSLRGLGVGQQAQKLNEFFGLLGITGASAISQNIAGTRDLQRQLANAGGTAERTAREMDAGLGGGIRRTMAAVEGLAISVGDALAPALQLVGGILTDSLGAFREWVNENKAAVTAITAAVAGVIGLGVSLIALALPFKILAVGIGMVTSMMSALGFVAGVSFALIKAGLLTLTSPLGLLMVAFDIWKTQFVATGLQQSGALAILRQGFSDLAETATTAWGGIAAAMQAGDLQGAWDVARLGLELGWLQLVDTMQNAWSAFTDWFKTTWVNDVVQAIVGALDVVMDRINDVREFLNHPSLGVGGTLSTGTLPPGMAGFGPGDVASGNFGTMDDWIDSLIGQGGGPNPRIAQLQQELRDLIQAQADARRFGTMDDWLDFLGEDERGASNVAGIARGMDGARALASAGGTFGAFGLAGLGAGKNIADKMTGHLANIERNTGRFAQPAFT